MESASKKRKICRDDDDDEDDEKETMEKFYALVKSIREARDRLMINNSEAAETRSKKRKLEEVKQVVVWKPSFQHEDFMEEAQLRKPPVRVASTSRSKEGTDDQKEEVKEGLDLSLSL
ncbi:hypothetical protein QUC31_005008 [Theobroma cacao]|uniref:Uncharacterized protein n=1 Tax=Theobroma cacao TaxID=3641 RepID=A0A061DTF8_THECC|nr:Uncharacterized protein TCM_004894 [Theobroma cacao]WRX11386.1 NPR1/NH1-interacting protein - like 2 [Theobroma cacao]